MVANGKISNVDFYMVANGKISNCYRQERNWDCNETFVYIIVECLISLYFMKVEVY